MNDRPDLKREDVEALASEMHDLKEVLREVSGKLGRIEKRLRVFFPGSFPAPKARTGKTSDVRESVPTITPQQALDLYSELVALARSGQEQRVAERAAGLELVDLALLVRELGAPLGKKPTRAGLTRSLMGRLKESVLLSRHTNRPPVHSSTREREGTEKTGGLQQTPTGSEKDYSSQ
jgi:hypothetical protein